MKKKKGLIAPLIAVGVVLIGLFVGFVVFGPEVKNLGFLSSKKSKQQSEASEKEFQIKNPRKASPAAKNSSVSSPTPSPYAPIPSTSPIPSPSPSLYRQPQGKYTILLPGDWKLENTNSGATYSTTKFSGGNGSISITFGSGKDPIGGCSETTSVVLYDRTISSCFILQRDGSQFMTRGYTKDKAGLDFTVEAIFNSPLAIQRPVVLEIIKSIDIE